MVEVIEKTCTDIGSLVPEKEDKEDKVIGNIVKEKLKDLRDAQLKLIEDLGFVVDLTRLLKCQSPSKCQSPCKESEPLEHNDLSDELKGKILANFNKGQSNSSQKSPCIINTVQSIIRGLTSLNTSNIDSLNTKLKENSFSNMKSANEIVSFYNNFHTAVNTTNIYTTGILHHLAKLMSNLTSEDWEKIKTVFEKNNRPFFQSFREISQRTVTKAA